MKASLSWLVLLSLLLLFATFAVMAERGESVMFKPTEHPFVEPPPKQPSQAEECEQLLKEIEALKGKPQRRHAAIERHKQACTE
ncbi:MAG: hypothetical protein ABW104_20465 [Candidatus Thiodiazotropha sp. 6PLUC2]